MRSKILTFILIFSFNSIFPCTYHIKNDTTKRIFVIDPNSKNGVFIEPKGVHKIDTNITGIKKIFITEALNFYEQEAEDPQSFKLKYQIRKGVCTLKPIELNYSILKKSQARENQRFAITSFK